MRQIPKSQIQAAVSAAEEQQLPFGQHIESLAPMDSAFIVELGKFMEKSNLSTTQREDGYEIRKNVKMSNEQAMYRLENLENFLRNCQSIVTRAKKVVKQSAKRVSGAGGGPATNSDDDPTVPGRPKNGTFELGSTETYKSGLTIYHMDMSKHDPDAIIKFIEDQKKDSSKFVCFEFSGPHGMDERNIGLQVFPTKFKEWAEEGIENEEFVDYAQALKELKALAKREKQRDASRKPSSRGPH